MSGTPNYWPGVTHYDEFNTFTSSTGSFGTLTNGTLTIVRNGGAATTSTGGSLTMDARGITGLNYVAIDTTDGSFYLGNCNYHVEINGGSVGTTLAKGLVVTRFTLDKQVSDARRYGGGTVAAASNGLIETTVGSFNTNGAGALRLADNRIQGTVVALADGSITVGSFTVAGGGALRLADNRIQGTVVALSDGSLTVGSFTVAAGGALADLVWDEVLEGSYTGRQMLRINAAAVAGKLSGAATTTVTIRSIDDDKDCIVATVDADGNRTDVTIDAS